MFASKASDTRGEHCLITYVNDYGHYGACLGHVPTRQFEHYMNERCREWSCNCKQLQSIMSRFCGHYCACFSITRRRGVGMADFIRYFNRDTGLNDFIVHELICSVM